VLHHIRAIFIFACHEALVSSALFLHVLERHGASRGSVIESHELSFWHTMRLRSSTPLFHSMIYDASNFTSRAVAHCSWQCVATELVTIQTRDFVVRTWAHVSLISHNIYLIE
jgi:hypothetical protein